MQQMSIFDYLNEKYKITKPIRLIELFAGYGSQALALEFLGVSFEHYKICEFDKYAIQTYNAFHNTNFEPSDITKIHASDLAIVDTNKYEYILFYSFPCTDLSIAGKMQGMAKGSQTRSGLLWEVERLLNECEELPQCVIMENVPTVLKAKGWEDWQEFLKTKGYRNFISVLNAKDYYIPQNRRRCFMVSILEGQGFNFPKKMKLDYVLKDIVDKNVDEKFFISKDISINLNQHPSKDLSEPQLHQVGELNIKGQDIVKRVYDPNGLAPTLTTMQGGNRQPKIIMFEIPQMVKVRKYPVDIESLKILLKKHKTLSNKEIAEKLHQPITLVEHWFRKDSSFSIPNADVWLDLKKLLGIKTTDFDKSIMTFEEREGVYEKSNRCYHENGLAPTLTAASANEKIITSIDKPVCLNSKGGRKGIKGLQPSLQDRIYSSNAISPAITTSFLPNYSIGYRVRKLTPSECFKLMGVPKWVSDKTPVSNSQQYKQAGNSIVTTVLMAIFGELLGLDYETKINELVEDLKACS